MDNYPPVIWGFKRLLLSSNELLDVYGSYVGNAKAKHPDCVTDIENLDAKVKKYFDATLQTADQDACYKLMNLGVSKMSELVSFVESIETAPLSEKISGKKCVELMTENKIKQGIIDALSKQRLLPELNELLGKARSVGVDVDEDWVLALCSVNLLETLLNKKLEELGRSLEGNFEERYNRLISFIRTEEKREIHQLLPLAMYKGIRNKLDHASHAHKVSSNEAQEICRIVTSILNDLFSSGK